MTPWLMTPVRRRVAPRPYRRQPCLSVSPKFVAPRADFSTTDFFNHGWTRMDTDSVVFIRVYPCLSVVNLFWLRPPISNRRYGRLATCATEQRFMGRLAAVCL